MANLNKTGLDTQIQAKINAVSNTTSAQTIHQLASTTVANTGVTLSVATINNLPVIYSDGIPVGTMVFVEENQTFYIAGDNQWLDLEGKVARIDFTNLWIWGENTNGKLGDGTTTNKCSPVSVIGEFTDWCSISNGVRTGAGIRLNGTLWDWGGNAPGQLGDGTTAAKCSPVSVVGGFTDWCGVSNGRYHTIAIRRNGSIWAWGCGDLGQLGNNSDVAFSSPVSVDCKFSWCKISTNTDHNLAIRNDGTLWAWGFNCFGQLGINCAGSSSLVNRDQPRAVLGGFNDWCQISAGQYHSAGVRENGTIWTWGLNCETLFICCFMGMLGDGTTVNKSSPVSVVGGFTDWCQVSAGNCHTAAIRQNGTLWTWGHNNAGQLGAGVAGNTSNSCSPVSVLGGFTDWCQVSAGCNSVAALKTNGTLWTWGRNNEGQLGDGTTVNKCSPISVSLLSKSDWRCISFVGKSILGI